MIQPQTFRFIVRSPLGAYKSTVYRDASYVLAAGFKLSITPEGICEEMTMTARNGVHPLDGSPGLGLRFADLVTVQMTDQASPQEADWVNLYYGQLRQGGNPYDYAGENQVLRSLAVKLRATPTPDKGYTQMDGGALARQLLQDTLASGALSTTVGGQTFSCVTYDPAAIPDLGFTMTLVATNQQPLGVLLDSIVATAKTAGIDARWGVRADAVLTLKAVSTAEVFWPAEQVDWKEPVAEVMYTSVLWDVFKRPDGRWFKYLSVSPEAATYGPEIKELAVGTGVKAWKLDPAPASVQGSAVVMPSGSNLDDVITDGIPVTGVTITGTGLLGSELFAFDSTSPKAAVLSLTIPSGGADRIEVTARGSSSNDNSGNYLQVGARVLVKYPDGNARYLGQNASDGYSSGVYFASDFPQGFPAGAVVTLYSDLMAAGTAPGGQTPPPQITVSDLRLTTLDTVLLDGLAKFHYLIPESAPGDLYRTGLLLPSDYGGKIRTPRPNGQPDYVANVSLWEYSVWDQGGVRTVAKIGDPDDPLATARAALSKKGDALATSNAVNLP